MRLRTLGVIIPMLSCVVLSVESAAAATYCQNGTHAAAKAPLDLMPRIAATLQIDKAAVTDGVFVRCVGAKLLACYVGANLNCGKANTERSLPGATEWCRQNPGSPTIPMVATGHDTIYEWSCQGRRAIAGKPLVIIDPQGYVIDNWKEIP
jgi:hypothetical protein